MENPTNLNPICPICNCHIEQEDQLLAYYYPPKRWWVVYHIKQKLGDKVTIGDTTIRDYKSWCALAGYQFKHHEESAELKDLRAWKEAAIEIEKEWDIQQLAESLGGTIGDSCRKILAKRIPEIVKENRVLKLKVKMCLDTFKYIINEGNSSWETMKKINETIEII